MFFRTVFITILSALFLFVGTAHSSPSVSKSDDPVEEESEFVIIPPISVAMYNKRKRPAGTMTIQMQLHIENDDQREEAKKIMPRLTSAYTQETAQLAANFFEISRPVNANILGRSLQKITDRLLRHDKARVLIGDIAVFRR